MATVVDRRRSFQIDVLHGHPGGVIIIWFSLVEREQLG